MHQSSMDFAVVAGQVLEKMSANHICHYEILEQWKKVHMVPDIQKCIVCSMTAKAEQLKCGKIPCIVCGISSFSQILRAYT